MSILVREFSKLYGSQKAVDAISFEIKRNEIVGFLGPNGAGKSTTMKAIAGYLPFDDGEIEVCGKSVKEYPLQVKASLGYLPEHNPLYLELYVKEYLRFIAGVHEIKQPSMVIDKAIDLVQLTDQSHKKIQMLSKGYRQRVGLAAALLHDPDVLILDEPTSGLDPNQIVEIRKIISDLGAQKTILLSTHIMQEVNAICDRVIILNKGKIVADKPVESLGDLISSHSFVFEIEFEHPPKIEDVQAQFLEIKIKEINASRFLISAKEDIRTQLFNFAVQTKNSIKTIKKVEKSIEQVFADLTKR